MSAGNVAARIDPITIKTAPMAMGAKLPASGLMTHMPMVSTRKKVPMNSTMYFFMF